MHSRLAAAIFGLGIVDVAYIDFILGPTVLAPAPRGAAVQAGSNLAAPALNARPHQGTGQPDSPARASDPAAVDDGSSEPVAAVPAAQPPRPEQAVEAAPPDSTDPVPEPTAQLPGRETLPSAPTVRPARPSVATRGDVQASVPTLADTQPSAATVEPEPVAEAAWTVLFPQAGKTELPEAAVEVVGQIAERLRQDRQLRLRIVGHADERGTRAHNWQVGKLRARAIARALEVAGVSPEQIEIHSEGEDAPAALGSVPEALARNRRVEMAIYAGRSQTP